MADPAVVERTNGLVSKMRGAADSACTAPFRSLPHAMLAIFEVLHRSYVFFLELFRSLTPCAAHNCRCARRKAGHKCGTYF